MRSFFCGSPDISRSRVPRDGFPRTRSAPTFRAVVQPRETPPEPHGRETGRAEAPIVEWYRLDASKRIVRTLAAGASLMLLGSIVSAAGLAVSRGALPNPLVEGRRDVLAADPAVEGQTGAVGGRPLVNGIPLLELTTGLLAFGCLLGGGLTAMLGLRRLLAEESYLALRHDGALFVHGDEERFVSWDDVEDVRWDAGSDALLFVAHDGEAVPLVARFADMPNEELAKRARAVRRRAIFGLLGGGAGSER